MEGLKKFVLKGMMPKETIEQRVKRLKGATLPGVKNTSLDLYYNDLKENEGQAYTARLEMWLANGTGYRIVHARCASFDDALEKIQEYEVCLIAGKKTNAFEVYEGERLSGIEEHKLWPFETRAEFTTFVDVLCRFDHLNKGGEPQTVGDLPRLRHGMVLLVHLPKRDNATEWIIDWFDYATLSNDGKSVRFVCIQDGYEHDVYPLDPYSHYAISCGKPLPKAYSLWLNKTRKDIIHELKGDKNAEYRG